MYKLYFVNDSYTWEITHFYNKRAYKPVNPWQKATLIENIGFSERFKLLQTLTYILQTNTCDTFKRFDNKHRH